MSEPVQPFGPFLIPADHSIFPAGWRCLRCREEVRKIFQMIPYLVARAVVYACDCGTIVTFEDERQPENAKHWRKNMKLLRAKGVEVAIFNGNRPTPPGFGGVN